MAGDKDDVVKALKSCLLTFKNGTSLKELNADFKMLDDRNIPFKALGYSTMESFVQSIPGIRTMRRGADMWVECITTKETEHISRMVAGQNASKSRRRRSVFSKGCRGAQGMSRNPVRAVNKPPNWAGPSFSGSNKSNTSAWPQVKQQIKPLFPTPPNSSGSRFTRTAGPQLSSPSKRMIEKLIQPRQELDYAVKPRSLMPTTIRTGNSTIPIQASRDEIPKLQNLNVEIPKFQNSNFEIPKFQNPNFEIPKFQNPNFEIPKFQNPNFEMPKFQSLNIEMPKSQNPNVPILGRPMSKLTGIPWQPPPSRISPMDRLSIPPLSSGQNPSVSNGNENIRVTFSNVHDNGAMSQMNFIPINPPPTMALPTNPLTSSQDPRDELRALARESKLPEPIFKIFPVSGKNSSLVYGKVEIGKRKYSSYPEEARNAIEAEVMAAREALRELKKEIESHRRLNPTTDREVMKARLLEIIDQHNGVFTNKIPAFYQEQFKETLPSNWGEEIKQWNVVTLDQGAYGSWILRRADPVTSDKPPEPSSSIEKGFLKPICPVEPGPLELPEKHFWVGYVTLVTSTTEIWVRLVGEDYSDKLEAMTSEMIDYYGAMPKARYPIEIGCYYVILENEEWHRVRVIDDVIGEDEVEVFFIDLGDDDRVEKSRLYPLDRKFSSLPCQAMRVALGGLEDFADCDFVLPRIEKILLEGVFYIEDVHRDQDELGPIATVVFYDTSDPDPEIDVVVNDLITRKILSDMTRKMADDEGKIPAVYVTHVEKNGDVYVQMENEILKILTKILDRLTNAGFSTEDLKRCALKKVDRSAIYFVRCTENGDWLRAKFVEVDANHVSKDSGRLKMFLLDNGRTISVDIANILQLEVLSDLAARIPPQAIKVRLANVEREYFDEATIEKLRELAPSGQLVLLKIVKDASVGTEDSTVVELFKRIEPDNVLVSINNTLALEPQLTKCVNGDGNNNVKPARRRVERANSRVETEETARALPAPKISPLGEYFDVHVTIAANPLNFTVQPLATFEELRIMMTKLQEVCARFAEGSHPPFESIRVGRLYAVKHTDSDWYRGCILNVVNEYMLTVYLVDHGNVVVVPLDKLLPLGKQFLDLPYQAIKARLVGIRPINVDWSTDDCLRFQYLVVGRKLVSIVAEVDADRHLPWDTVLGLKLIDVSSNDDINIGDILVQEGRAVHVD